MATRKIIRVVVHYDDGSTRELPALWIEKGWLTKPKIDFRKLEKRRNKRNAQTPRKLTPAMEQRIVAAYRVRVAQGRKYGALKALAAEYQISTTHLADLLRKHGAR